MDFIRLLVTLGLLTLVNMNYQQTKKVLLTQTVTNVLLIVIGNVFTNVI